MLDHSDQHLAAHLSQAGLARRAAMLPELQRAVVARGRRRVIARAAIVAVPVLVLALGVAVLFRASDPSTGPTIGAPIAIETSPEAPALIGAESTVPEAESLRPMLPSIPALASDFEAWSRIPRARVSTVPLIRTASPDTTLLIRSRYRGHAHIPTASDDDLVAALRASGYAAGLVRTPDGARVLPDRPGEL